MKTILTALALDVDAAIAEAHAALVELERKFRYENLHENAKEHRHLVLDALALLAVEVGAKAADVQVDADRRILLGGSLLNVKLAIADNAWGFLVGDDDAEREANIALVERFEAARRTITVACYDLETMMD